MSEKSNGIGDVSMGLEYSSSSSKKRRNKPTLVCLACKKRKIKCDRKTPCTACVKTNAGFACTYETRKRPKNKKPLAETGFDGDGVRLSRQRIQQLETGLPDSTNSTHSTDGGHGRDFLLPLGSEYASFTANPYIYNPLVAEDDVINFYKGYSALHIWEPLRRINLGPLSWNALVQKDPWLRLFKKSVELSYTNFCFLTRSLPSVSQMLDVHNVANSPKVGLQEQTFRKRDFTFRGFEELIPYAKRNNKTMKQEQLALPEKRGAFNPLYNQPGGNVKLNVSARTLGKTLFEGKFDGELELIEKVKSIMPKRKVVWSLLDTFFKRLYPFAPFLDREYFYKDLASILGPVDYDDDSPFADVKIEKKLDLAIVAILLIVLRLTYLSLFSNRDVVNESAIENLSNDPNLQKLQYLLSNPINLAVIEAAQLCIDCFQYTRKTNMTVFQSLLYMRVYHTLAPEDGDGADGGDSQVATATLIHLAYSLGLNREPDSNCTDPRINILARKIWFFLLRTDVLHCFSIGNPTTIDFRHFDVLPPEVTAENQNIDNLELDETSALLQLWLYLKLHVVKEILDIVLDVRGFTPVNKLTGLLSSFESDVRKDFCGSDKADRNQDESIHQIPDEYISITSFGNAVNSKVVLQTATSFLAIYFHIFLHYEEIGNTELCFFYLKKIFYIMATEIVPVYFDIMYGNLSNYGFTLNPAMQMALHKSNQIILSCLIRVNHHKWTMDSNPQHAVLMGLDPEYQNYYRKHCRISDICRFNGRSFSILFEKFASRYYYAWRISKTHSFIFKRLSSPELYQEFLVYSKELKSSQFTSTQLDGLIETLESIQQGVDYVANFKDLLGPVLRVSGREFLFKKESASSADLVMQNSPATTPHSFSESPTSATLLGANADIDNMWLLMLAMKNNEPENGDSAQNGKFGAPFPPTNVLSYPQLPPGVLEQRNSIPYGMSDFNNHISELILNDELDFFADYHFDGFL